MGIMSQLGLFIEIHSSYLNSALKEEAEGFKTIEAEVLPIAERLKEERAEDQETIKKLEEACFSSPREELRRVEEQLRADDLQEVNKSEYWLNYYRNRGGALRKDKKEELTRRREKLISECAMHIVSDDEKRLDELRRKQYIPTAEEIEILKAAERQLVADHNRVIEYRELLENNVNNLSEQLEAYTKLIEPGSVRANELDYSQKLEAVRKLLNK